MSNEQAMLPPIGEATDTIYGAVHARAFLSKMAAFGHAPATEEEAVALVELGFKLANADPQSLVPADPFAQSAEAPAPLGKYASASAALDEVLGVPKQAHDESLEQAHQLAQDPAIYQAALAIKVAQAEQLAAAEPQGEPAAA